MGTRRLDVDVDNDDQVVEALLGHLLEDSTAFLLLLLLLPLLLKPHLRPRFDQLVYCWTTILQVSVVVEKKSVRLRPMIHHRRSHP